MAGNARQDPPALEGGGANAAPEHEPARRVKHVPRRRKAAGARKDVAANDDAPSIGGLIFALHQKPSRKPFLISAIASAIWFALSLLLGWAMLSDEIAAAKTAMDVISTPGAIAVAATIAIPIALFWFLALLIWRAQELRLMSSAMTEVAVRLAEPDRLAEQSIASLGQTVRRQVSAMNDAISRALGRAGELEALVHSEVAALDKCYTANEQRIRSMVEELASERTALASNSDKVSEVLRGIGAQVSKDIAGAGENATRALVGVTQSMAQSLEARGSKISNEIAQRSAEAADRLDGAGKQLTTTLQSSTDQAHALLSEKSNTLLQSLHSMNQRVQAEIPSLLERLGGEQERLSKILEDAGQNLAALETALSQRTGTLETALSERTQHLQTVLTEYTSNLDTKVGQRVKVLDTTLATHAKAIDTALVHRVNAIDERLGERTRNLDLAINKSSKEIEIRLEEHATKFDGSLGNYAKHMEHTIGKYAGSIDQHAQQLNDAISGKLQHIDGALTEQAKTFEQALSQTAMHVSRAIQTGSEALEGQIIERTRAIDEAFTGRIRALDETIVRGTAAIDAAVGDKATALGDAMKSHANAISDALRRQAIEMDETVVRGIEAVRGSGEQIASHSIQTIEGLAKQANVLKGVSHDLLAQIHGLTDRFENQSQNLLKAAHALESSNFRLDSVLEGRQTALGEVLTALAERVKDFDAMLNTYAGALSAATINVGSLEAASPGGEQAGGDDRLTDLRGRFSALAKEIGDAGGTGPFPPKPSNGGEGATMAPGSLRDAGSNVRGAMTDQLRALEQLSSLGGNRHGSEATRPDAATGVDASRSADGGTQDRLPKLFSGTGDDADPLRALAGRPVGSDTSAATPDLRPQAPAEQRRQGGTGEELARDAWSLHELLQRASGGEGRGTSTSGGGAIPSLGELALPGDRAVATGAPINLKKIAGAIDTPTAARIWGQYRKGERGLFSRQIYTNEGRATFDEISRRFQHEPGFQVTVNRYLTDFERYLQEAQAKDASGSTVETYLTSETGRVYLLLAHVAGRIS